MKIDRRKLRQGSVATAITAVVAVVIVLIILLADTLDARYQLAADLTEEQVFALSDPTREYMENLTQELTVYVLTTEANLTGGDVYYLQANEVIRQYGAYPNVTLEYIDLNTRPDFARDYPQYQLNGSTILLVSGERTITVSINDLFETETELIGTGYAEYIVSSRAEQVMTGAILGITRENPGTVSILSGFGEGGTEAFEELLKTNHYTVLHQNLLLEEIDPSADMVVISAPTRDYSEAELQKLDDFLNHGGAFGKTLFYLADVYQPDTPNLEAFLADWGVEVLEGVVRENDSDKLITNSSFWGIAQYTEEVYSARALAQGMYTAVPEARPMRLLFTQRGAIEVAEPLIFTETACIQPLGELPAGWSSNQAEPGPFTALAVATKTAYGTADESAASHVVVGASSILLEETLLQSPYMGNADFLLGLVGTLTGREEELSIAPKSIGVKYLPISQFEASLLSSVFTVLLPLLVLVVGIAVFLQRRHR